jgi:putative FmdB family regulatory protein
LLASLANPLVAVVRHRADRATIEEHDMPLYTYACGDHGQFSAWGRMSESDAPQPCPSCREPAGRALARPAIGGRSDGGGDAAYGMGGCGAGACATGATPMMAGGGCCGGGACVH